MWLEGEDGRRPVTRANGRPDISEVLDSHRPMTAALADDGRDQLGRGHVERRIVDRDAVGRGLAAETVRHLARISLFDRNLGAAGNRKIERAARRGDIEGDLVGRGQTATP